MDHFESKENNELMVKKTIEIEHLLRDFVDKYSEDTDSYYNENLIKIITSYLTVKQMQDYIDETFGIPRKITRIFDEYREGMMNRCLECGVDMGIHNPRQLCGKYICLEKGE